MTRVMMVMEPTSGGTARHVAALAHGCVERGVDVRLVCAVRSEEPFREELTSLESAGVPVDLVDMRHEIHPLHDGAAALRIRRLVTAASPDVLHLHSSKAGALGRSAMVGLGRRAPAVVYSPHAYAFLAQRGFLNRVAYWCVERALLPWTHRVVAVSQSEGHAATRLGGGDRVIIIPNGIESPRLPAATSGIRRPLRVGWLGRLAWQKNPEAAVTVSFVLTRLGIEHELLLGGDGSRLLHLHRAMARVGSDHRVRLLGYVDDTDSFHASIDALLITSRSEGLPYAGLDAMARGVPIVGFDVPGVRDLVIHGATGLLAPAGDSGALAAHLARLARDGELRRRLGLAARLRVCRDFHFDAQIDRLCGLYQSLASSRAAAAA